MPRALPPNPSLDQLRRQAKDLLRSARALDLQALLRIEQYLPDRSGVATLADAQLVVAREYGFPSWPKLKRQVEALAAQQVTFVEQAPAHPARETPYKRQIRELADRILEAAARGAIQQVLACLVIPARDGTALRDYLVEQGTYSRLVDALLAGVDHTQPRVRFLVAQAMDHFADDRCVAPLRTMLKDAVPRVRWAALHSLSCEECKLTPIAQNDDLVELVSELALHDPSVRVRRVAAYSLGGSCYDPRAVAALEQLLASATDPATLRSARWALGQQQRLAAEVTKDSAV
jgi:hypothetical protein